MSGVAAREWQRFTPRERWGRTGVYLTAAVAIGLALRGIEVVPEFLADTPAQVADLLVRMWPIDWGFLLRHVVGAMVETLHIATLGTMATLVIAFPLGILAAANIMPNPLVRSAAKFCLVASRSVNSLVWALFFVAVFGPGAFAGRWRSPSAHRVRRQAPGRGVRGSRSGTRGGHRGDRRPVAERFPEGLLAPGQAGLPVDRPLRWDINVRDPPCWASSVRAGSVRCWTRRSTSSAGGRWRRSSWPFSPWSSSPRWRSRPFGSGSSDAANVARFDGSTIRWFGNGRTLEPPNP